MDQHNNPSPSFINVAVLLVFAVVIAVGSSVTTYFFLNSRSNEQYSTTQTPVIPQSPTNVLPNTIPATTTQTVPDETANWKVYRNEKYGYEIKHPPYLKLDAANTVYSVLFLNITSNSNFPSLYISVIPDELFTNLTPSRFVYNFMEREFIDSFFSMKVGENNIKGDSSSPYSEFFTYKKLLDVTVAYQKGVTVENKNVWDGAGHTDRRVFVKKSGFTYMIGTYYQTADDLSNFQTFLSTFKFLE